MDSSTRAVRDTLDGRRGWPKETRAKSVVAILRNIRAAPSEFKSYCTVYKAWLRCISSSNFRAVASFGWSVRFIAFAASLRLCAVRVDPYLYY
ncbi:hypothetical protein AB1N83_006511 [Pleurotus pulmonarius]